MAISLSNNNNHPKKIGIIMDGNGRWAKSNKLKINKGHEKGVGVGEHSTKDFYDNAEEALSMMADAIDRIEALEMFRQDQENKHNPVFYTQPKNK